eukprot:9499879-Pyramimonas_sp.AAC.1
MFTNAEKAPEEISSQGRGSNNNRFCRVARSVWQQKCCSHGRVFNQSGYPFRPPVIGSRSGDILFALLRLVPTKGRPVR